MLVNHFKPTKIAEFRNFFLDFPSASDKTSSPILKMLSNVKYGFGKLNFIFKTYIDRISCIPF